MLSLGRTVFFSSHVLEVVEKLCTSLAIIDAGRIVYQSTMAALREQQEGKSLEEIFVEKVGEKRLASADLNWLN
jgi:ABC-2 type transport system ATP-binding protein